MADVDYVFESQTTLSTQSVSTTDVFEEPTNTCKVLGSLLTASTKYLIVAKGRIGGSTTGGHINIRVSTADDTDIAAKSASKWEPGPGNTGSGSLVPWMFVRSFTTDSSPADVKIEIARSDTIGSIYTDQLALTLIDLDDLGSSNYIEATYDSTTDLNGGIDMATISTLAASTEYLFLGYGKADGDSAVGSYGIELFDGTTQKTAAFLEIEDTRENRLFGVMGAWTTTGTPNDAKLVGTADAANVADSSGSYLIAVKTSALNDFDYSFSVTGESILAATDTTVESISLYEPSSAGYHLVLGRVNTTDASRIGATVQVPSNDTLYGDITPKTLGYNASDETNVEVVGVSHISESSNVILVVNAVAAETTAYEFVAVARLDSVPGLGTKTWGMIPIGI